MTNQPIHSELGKKSAYESTYNPKLLFPIPRVGKRDEIGIDSNALPFFGFDYWNHYEVSWLNAKGKPMVAIAEIYYDCSTTSIIESKSLKLYFNSLNNSNFASSEALQAIVKADLSQAVDADVTVFLHSLRESSLVNIQSQLNGDCIDDLDIADFSYTVQPELLTCDDGQVEERLYSDLLKSNCLVTYQPDWGSVQIIYKGQKINREGLLRYIVSFRNHNEFHEQCIERIFVDIMSHCKPDELTVYGRYTRRGGLDINPYRSTNSVDMTQLNQRLVRQ